MVLLSAVGHIFTLYNHFHRKSTRWNTVELTGVRICRINWFCENRCIVPFKSNFVCLYLYVSQEFHHRVSSPIRQHIPVTQYLYGYTNSRNCSCNHHSFDHFIIFIRFVRLLSGWLCHSLSQKGRRYQRYLPDFMVSKYTTGIYLSIL